MPFSLFTIPVPALLFVPVSVFLALLPTDTFLFPSLGDGLLYPVTHQRSPESGFSQRPAGLSLADGDSFAPLPRQPQIQYDSIALSQSNQPQLARPN